MKRIHVAWRRLFHESPPADRNRSNWMFTGPDCLKWYRWHCALIDDRAAQRRQFLCRMNGGYITCPEEKP